MQTPWEYRYAHRTQKMGSSVIRELLKLTEQPDIISFGGGLPAPEVFPVKEFKEACNTVLETMGAQALQYGTTEGYTPLREMIARHTGRYGIKVNANNIAITSGSQQALDLWADCSSTGAIILWLNRPLIWARSRRGMPTARNTSLSPPTKTG